MSTPEHANSYDGARPGASAPVPLWRRPIALGGAAAVVAAAAVGWVLLPDGDDGAVAPGDATTVTYAVAEAGAMSSCMPVADYQPSRQAAALGGVVTEVTGAQVTLDVDKWYQGGDADFVELTGADQSVALDGVDFVVGERYLVTAVDGTVQICGISAQDSPELEQLYDGWYG